MRWTMIVALAGAVFAVASSEITKSDQGTPSSLITDKSEKAEHQQSEQTTKSSVASNEIPAKNGSESNSAPKMESKREIPDAVVDHPEEFEKQAESEELEVDDPAIHIIPEGDLPLIQTSSFDEDADKYPFYEAEERKKRGVESSRKRSKREQRFDEDTPEILKILESLKKGREQQKQFQHYGRDHYHHHYNHQQEDEHEQQQPVDYLEWDNDSAQESDRIVNDVLESLGLGRSSKLIIPNEPENRDKFIPIAKLRVPFARRPIL